MSKYWKIIFEGSLSTNKVGHILTNRHVDGINMNGVCSKVRNPVCVTQPIITITGDGLLLRILKKVQIPDLAAILATSKLCLPDTTAEALAVIEAAIQSDKLDNILNSFTVSNTGQKPSVLAICAENPRGLICLHETTGKELIQQYERYVGEFDCIGAGMILVVKRVKSKSQEEEVAA